MTYDRCQTVKWYCKRQSTVETSTYGAEINAYKRAGELVIEYCYKLRMLGVPLKDKAFVYGDILLVLINGSRPESVLKKKTHACYFHFVTIYNTEHIHRYFRSIVEVET